LTRKGIDQATINAVERILEPFVNESLPAGGIDASKSLWQKPGRGSASGSDLFPGRVDVRYLRFLVEVLYRMADMTDNPKHRLCANEHVRFMARIAREDHPTWSMGNALETIGLYHRHNEQDESLVESGRRILGWARRRKVTITTKDGVTFQHFPCGYGFPYAKDAGWTNDLSMFGSGLVWMYESTRDAAILDEATSFAEYFLQPWHPDSVGDDGYWHCGTWRDDLGSWVIGPAHYTGFESTDAYGDETSWIFSTMTCTDYLTRLYRHNPDPRFLDRCVRAARWTFEHCQFGDGAIGLCERDDKWLGSTGDAVSQVAMLKPLVGEESSEFSKLLEATKRSFDYLRHELPRARIEEHGVRWVTRKTSLDPLVNVGMLWASAILGYLNGLDLEFL